MLKTKRLGLKEIKQEIREYDWHYSHRIHFLIKGKKERWDGVEMMIFTTTDRKIQYWCQMTARGWTMTDKTITDRGVWTRFRAT